MDQIFLQNLYFQFFSEHLGHAWTQIILDNNYEDELAYLFNVYKDDIDPMQVQTEAFWMSTMFQGSNCKKFSDILRIFTPD